MITLRTEYSPIDEAARLMGVSVHQARRLLADTPAALTRYDHTGRGRPRTLYHFSAHPRLAAGWHGARKADATGGPTAKQPASRTLHPASRPQDLLEARLRLRAVLEYLHRQEAGMDEARAAIATATDWAIRPRTEVLPETQRIGRHQRARDREVTVGEFSISTLRRWASIYKDRGRRLEALIPERASTGRRREEVPDALVDLIAAYAAKSPRASISAAIRQARHDWGGDWPDVSNDTLRRRVRERDPARTNEALGKAGIAKLRKEHTPDVNLDWASLPYNGRWELDDVTQDFYGHSAEDATRLLRPYAYAIIRTATRQWIGAVACETPITQDQVRALVGLALANPAGGIPDEIKFERGTVACEPHLESLLTDCGIRVSRTSMDGGRVHPGALEDRATGHFQGKGVIERAFREHHNHQWLSPADVGTDERTSKQARLDTLLAEARRRAAQGEGPLILPTAQQWQRQIHGALAAHNATPHGSLPRIIDPTDGKPRHMTPDEYAATMAPPSIPVLADQLLPLFFTKGRAVRVTRNGITIDTLTYGRYDDDLAALQGTQVTAYADPDIPGVVYVHELGRCLDADQPVAPGSTEADRAIAAKRRIERTQRNQYEALIARVTERGDSVIAEQTRFLASPVADRAQAASPERLAARTDRITHARLDHAHAAVERAARFDVPDADSIPAAPRAANPALSDLEALEGLF